MAPAATWLGTTWRRDVVARRQVAAGARAERGPVPLPAGARRAPPEGSARRFPRVRPPRAGGRDRTAAAPGRLVLRGIAAAAQRPRPPADASSGAPMPTPRPAAESLRAPPRPQPQPPTR